MANKNKDKDKSKDKVIRRCGLYIRVSTEEQAMVEEGSIKNQGIRLKRFVDDKNSGKDYSEKNEKNEQWVIVKEYIEEGKSATTTKRPKYQEMLQDIKAGVINMVLFTELSRLSRSTKDFLDFGEHAKENNVDFVCIQNQELSTTTSYGKMLLTLLVTLAQFESELTSDRTRKSVAERARRGLWGGGQILGYDLIPDKKGYLSINPTEEEIIKFIYRSYLREKSFDTVANLCNQRGYKTKSFKSRRDHEHKGRNFSYSSTRQILSNPTYIARKEINKGGKNKENSEYEAKPTTCWERIIDDDVFDEVQKIIALNSESHSNAKHTGKVDYPFLMSNLLFCEHCNRDVEQPLAIPLTHGGTRKNGKLISHYIHRKNHRKANCPLPQNISAEVLDKVIWDRLVEDSQMKLMDDLISETATGAHTKDDKIQTLRKDLTETQKKRAERETEYNNIMVALGKNADKAGNITSEFLAKLSTDIEDMKRQEDELKQEIKKCEERASSAFKVAQIIRNKPKSLNQLPPDKKIQTVRALIKSITLRLDAVILDRHFEKPIVGQVKERAGARSNRYRFMDIDWLN